MPWTAYDYRAGPKGATLTQLSTLCKSVRVVDESSAGNKGGNVPVQYMHGAREIAHLFTDQNLIPLECVLRFTNSAGVITHADGANGHAYDNMEALKAVLYGDMRMVTVQREVPDWGQVQIDGKVFAPVASSQNRFTFLFPILCADPFWRSTTLQSVNPSPSVTVGGSAPVHDAEIVFPAAAVNPLLTHTQSDGTAGTIQVTGTIPAGGVRVYTKDGFAQRITGGTDYGEFLVQSEGYVLELHQGVNSFSYSGGGTATIEWRNKWR